MEVIVREHLGKRKDLKDLRLCTWGRAASDYMHGLEDEKLEGSPAERGIWLMAR